MLTYKITSEKNLPESEVALEVEISAETLGHHRASGLKKLSSTVSIPGFRVGHVPENIVIQKIGESAILKEASYDAIEEALPEILKEKKLAMIGEPQVQITKLASGNPLTFKITLSVLPEFTLPDYKKIATSENTKKPEDVSVSDKELNDFIDSVRKSFAENTAPKSETSSKEKPELPELNDEFVKKLGAFKDVEDFKSKIKENLGHEKAHKAHEKKRLTIAEGIMDKTKVVVPKAMIESEIVKMLARFHDDVARMGLKMEDYLKNIKKTENDLRKEWRKDAEKNAKLQLILNSIAGQEKIMAPEEAVAHEVKHLMEQYKDVDLNRASAYITMMLTNEKVFEFLEGLK